MQQTATKTVVEGLCFYERNEFVKVFPTQNSCVNAILESFQEWCHLSPNTTFHALLCSLTVASKCDANVNEISAYIPPFGLHEMSVRPPELSVHMEQNPPTHTQHTTHTHIRLHTPHPPAPTTHTRRLESFHQVGQASI